MYTNKSMKIISRLQSCLDLIQEANNRLRRTEADLRLYEHSNPFDLICLMNTRSGYQKKITRYSEISRWLELRYLSMTRELKNEAARQIQPELLRA